MNKFTSSIYLPLLSFSRKNWAARQLSYFAAGWVSLVGISPGGGGGKPKATLQDIAIAVAVVCIGFLMIGRILSQAQPLIQHAGPLTVEKAVVSVVLVLNLWRYLKGRKIMRELRED